MQLVLMITGNGEVGNCASILTKQLGVVVEIAVSRREALTALRRREYTVVVIDEPIAEASADGAEQIWKLSGLAIPMQLNFAISGTHRILREVRAALQRREQEKQLAMRAAATSIENDLRDTVTGLLLYSQLALAESDASSQLAAKLETMVHLCGVLRARLDQGDAFVSLPEERIQPHVH